LQKQEEKQRVGEELHKACRDVGFFYVKNHGTSILKGDSFQ
jgi:isopenicillin N synthase-like dioxygenase